MKHDWKLYNAAITCSFLICVCGERALFAQDSCAQQTGSFLKQSPKCFAVIFHKSGLFVTWDLCKRILRVLSKLIATQCMTLQQCYISTSIKSYFQSLIPTHCSTLQVFLERLQARNCPPLFESNRATHCNILAIPSYQRRPSSLGQRNETCMIPMHPHGVDRSSRPTSRWAPKAHQMMAKKQQKRRGRTCGANVIVLS